MRNLSVMTVVLMWAAVVTFAPVVLGETQHYYVATTGSDASGDGTQDNPWKTPAYALGRVSGTVDDPVEIHLAPGTYDMDMGEGDAEGDNFPLSMKSHVSLVGSGQDLTTLDAEQAAYHIVYCSGVSCCAIKGLRMTGGCASATSGNHAFGGAVSCFSSSVTIADCKMTNNSAHDDGGAVFCRDSDVSMSNCVLVGNEAGDDGGGLSWYTCTGTISDCFFRANSSDEHGGALYFDESAYVTISNCLVTENASVLHGGGICSEDLSCLNIVNCTVDRNSGNYVGGIGLRGEKSSATIVNTVVSFSTFGAGIWACNGCTANISYCNVYGNAGGRYSGSLGDQTGSNGNISKDPQYCSRGGYTNHDGYFLKQKDDGQGWGSPEYSPCVNAGDPTNHPFGGGANTQYSTAVNAFLDTDTVDIGYHYKFDGCTFIALESFQARPVAGRKVLISWQTGAEIDTVGFVLFRSSSGAESFGQISGLIPGQGSAACGSSYSFVDSKVKPGATYYYYLIDLERDGGWTVHGPVSVVLPGLDWRALPRLGRHPVAR